MSYLLGILTEASNIQDHIKNNPYLHSDDAAIIKNNQAIKRQAISMAMIPSPLEMKEPIIKPVLPPSNIYLADFLNLDMFKVKMESLLKDIALRVISNT